MILVIGYGNPLRSDDAIGQHLAWELKQHFGQDDLLVQIDYQLTPEMAELVSHFDVVIFLDARADGIPGEMLQEMVEPLAGAGAFTHNVTPAALLGMANELYGTRSAGLLLSIVGEEFDYGTNLSARLARKVPALTRQTADIIKHHLNIQTHKANNHA